MSLINNIKNERKNVMKQPNYSVSMTAQIIDDYQISNDDKFAAILEEVKGLEKNEEDLENFIDKL